MNSTIHKKSLLLAVAAALGMVAPLAQANLITSLADNSDASARKFAIEESGESSKDYYGRTEILQTTPTYALSTQDLTVHVPVIAGYTVTSINRMILKLTLTGGAKFANKAFLICSHSAAGAGSKNTVWRDGSLGKGVATNDEYGFVLSAQNGQLAAGGTNATTAVDNATNGVSAFLLYPTDGGIAGSTTATYNFPSGLITRVGVANGSGAGCIVTFGAAGVFGGLATAGGVTVGASSFVTAFNIGTRQNIGMKTEITYVDAGVTRVITNEQTIIKFVTALTSVIQAGNVATIDVGKKASKEFTVGTVAEIGKFNLTAAQTTPPRVASGWASYTVGSVGSTALVSGMVSGFSITIAGSTIAGAKQAWVTEDANCGGANRRGLAQIAATSGGSSTVTLAVTAIGDPATAPNYFNSTSPLKICLEVPGTTLLSDGQLTATITGLAKNANFLLDMGSGGNLSKIDRNGAVVRVLNIPAVGNADQAFIRIYNTSSLPTKVRGTLYGQDGKTIGTVDSVLFEALKPNDVEILDAAKLQAKVAATAPWTGRAWLLIQADVDKEAFKVQALIRTPGTPGVLVNLSGEAYN